ncbi:hypothetical protein [Maribellus maritimus]|uniref:hypothetical protein n=1 Tax=Maribellus maritimus TaxID=2870838 RepID=UPI001EE9D54B|nr:hypothetical protein [Maribellus maritimus]MCG6189335.1 hypothetical protein [Maribellus maritimus]
MYPNPKNIIDKLYRKIKWWEAFNGEEEHVGDKISPSQQVEIERYNFYNLNLWIKKMNYALKVPSVRKLAKRI